jgi:ATP-dependent RNA helicase DHX37/DHR1
LLEKATNSISVAFTQDAVGNEKRPQTESGIQRFHFELGPDHHHFFHPSKKSRKRKPSITSHPQNPKLVVVFVLLTMRRSKSDPAKYARNYRKISQRRMTQYDGLDEEKEMESLRAILKNSKDHLKDDQEDGPIDTSLKNKRKRDKSLTEPSDHINASLLSEELQLEQANLGDNPLIVLPSKKKKKAQKPKVQLTKEEIKQAKALQKKTSRKLETLEKRAEQKKLRTELYEKLEKHQVSAAATAMLSSSGALSRKSVGTKKQILQKLLKKERAGVTLTEDEKEMLYPERIVEELPEEVPATRSEPAPPVADKKPEKSTEEDASAKKKSKNKKGKTKKENDEKEDDVDAMDTDTKADSDTEQDEKIEKEKESKPAECGFNFAAQMMASLSQLNQDSTQKRIDDEARPNEEEAEEMPLPSNKTYVPSEPTVLKTAATLGIQSISFDSKRKVMRITRPEVIEKARYDLPVSAMEFEIMDAIRNNDVTILCGETGSGKSTQVPQFLYESGFSVNSSDSSKSFLIGITQPRRVAAVSTAKRVCYEVGQGDGQVIKSSGKKGNLVSYQTRYETAGLGSETRIKFMTDGILLQEIQNDLLLRKYSVIVLDESHERNLNTDVLIGLLSVALPLRKKAAEEDPSVVPLRLILMSATLRVEDFTKNDKLFPTGPPAVVTVPGRTHPVTIHHSKATELDDYGKLKVGVHASRISNISYRSLISFSLLSCRIYRFAQDM